MSDGNDRKPGEQEARADAAIVDPMATWRSFSNATMDSWAKTMVQWVNTDDFAKYADSQPIAPGPFGGIQDSNGNFGTPMNGVVTVVP